jgi:DNA polymerase III epsilon subunit-like protein
LAGQTIVAYNMDFDWRMLQQTAQVYGLPNVRVAHKHCAMKEYARFKGQFDLKKRQYSWHSLSTACTQQKIPVENAHDALGDVRMTLALIRRMAE